MKLLINRNVVYAIIVVVGLLLGVGLFLLFNNFESIKDTVSGLFERTPVAEQPKDEEIPYFADVDRDVSFGDEGDWLFKTFQPRVTGYYEKDEMHYMTVEYFPNRSDDPVSLDVMLMSNEEPERIVEVSADKDKYVFWHLIVSKIMYSDDFTPSQNGEGVDLGSYLEIDEVKEKFKVGDRIAMKILFSSPGKEERTDAYCDPKKWESYLCRHAEVLDLLNTDLTTLFMAEPIKDGSVLFPLVISDDVSVVSSSF